ncbi:MAG: RNA methyltransferase [Muribaculaceae bacterium]|nr:RNA methyltransferase [Muribaculaceae bacterium]
MKIVKVESLDLEGIAPYARLTESQLRRPASGFGTFIAESPKVIDVALRAGYEPLSILCESKHISGDAAEIISRCPADMPVYTGSREILEKLTGYKLTRGVLCQMKRKSPLTVEEVCVGAHRVAVIDAVSDTTNIGAIFRSAAALGIDAVVLTPLSCDPLNRRSIRVSMGSVFLVPWCWGSVAELKAMGFRVAALALTDDSISIEAPVLKGEERLAMVFGTEGDGLSDRAIAECDYTVKIPMFHGVDSLNVAAASAVTFYVLQWQG